MRTDADRLRSFAALPDARLEAVIARACALHKSPIASALTGLLAREWRRLLRAGEASS